jgi:hypothetical protein
LAKHGAGKTSATLVIVEEILKNGLQVVIAESRRHDLGLGAAADANSRSWRTRSAMICRRVNSDGRSPRSPPSTTILLQGVRFALALRLLGRLAIDLQRRTCASVRISAL